MTLINRTGSGLIIHNAIHFSAPRKQENFKSHRFLKFYLFLNLFLILLLEFSCFTICASFCCTEKWISYKHISSLCHHRALSRVLCAIQQVLISSLFYTCAKLLQLCWTLCDPMGYSPPGSSIHGFSRQKYWYWSGLPFPSPGDLSDPGIKPMLFFLLCWHASSLPLVPPGKLVLYTQ